MDQSVSCVVYKRGVFVVVVFGSILFRCSCLFGLSGFICDLCLLLAFCRLSLISPRRYNRQHDANPGWHDTKIPGFGDDRTIDRR